MAVEREREARRSGEPACSITALHHRRGPLGTGSRYQILRQILIGSKARESVERGSKREEANEEDEVDPLESKLWPTFEVIVGLPPAWVDVSEEIAVNVQRVRTKMADEKETHLQFLISGRCVLASTFGRIEDNIYLSNT